jgi:hypothetical protein
MILEKQTEANIVEQGTTQESIGMSLDLDSAQILMQMLSKNLYSDDIGSTVRECASNALDSHRRAGVHMPIIVGFKPAASGNYEFTVEDFGVGLDADDVKNIISKYGKSTKRDSATELGMMGLGFKAPLAYSSSFYFVCRKNGMERKYMMYEGEDVNTIDLLYEEPTAESNGVKIIIPVKYQDSYQFRRKIKEQLCYFESVYFDVPEDASITNGFVIARHEHFQFSELADDSYLHVCLDNVYYPLDFGKLGIDSIRFPIALRFSLSDGIYPTPNREALRYTKEAKDIILEKLKTVANYYVDKYNTQVESGTDVKSIINYIESTSRYVSLGNGKRQDISQFQKYATTQFIAPKLEGLELFDIAHLHATTNTYWLGEYATQFELRSDRIYATDKSYCWSFRPNRIAEDKVDVYVYTGKLSQVKKDYVKSLYPSYSAKNVVLVKHAYPKVLGKKGRVSDLNYRHILSLDKYPKSEWRTRIKDYQHVVALLTEGFIDLDAINIPEAFIESRKKAKAAIAVTTTTSSKRLKVKGEIVGKKGIALMRYVENRSCKFDSQLYKLEDLESAKHLKVYTNHADYLKLDSLYAIKSKQKIEVITFSERELKIVNSLDIHNIMSFDKFMEGNNAPFKRIVTAYLIHKFIRKYESVFNKREIVGFISTNLSDRMKVLMDYRSKNYGSGTYPTSTEEELYKAMLAVAEENNLFDMNVYPELLQLQELFDKLPFLNPLCRSIGYFNAEDPMVNVVTDLFKYHRQKVDLKHYNVKLNEEVLTEEQVEELLD